MDYLNKGNLYYLNTSYRKTKQIEWTWNNLDGKIKNEVEYIISNNKKICTDVSVLNQFDTSSNHRLVRASFSYNFRTKRNKIINQIKITTIGMLRWNEEIYQEELTQKLVPVNALEKCI